MRQLDSACKLLKIPRDPKALDNYVAACQIGITLSSIAADDSCGVERQPRHRIHPSRRDHYRRLQLAGHGTVPEMGASVAVSDYHLVVEEMEGRKITRVLVRPVEGDDE